LQYDERVIDPGYIDHLLDLLAPTVRCTGKKMFGGWGIMSPTGMIGLVSADRCFYLKTDATTRPTFLAAGGIPFQHRGKTGKTMSLPYVTPPERALESADDMRPWAELALGVMRRRADAASTKKKRPAVKKAAR
jgi:DNA transformation protein